MVILIAAVGRNSELGKDNQLLWHLPDDFKRFKQVTTGHYIIMGRKTFESFPKLLPNRTHVIITRQENYHPEGCIIASGIEDALAKCPENEDVFVIGGGEIFKLAMPFADKLDLTEVDASFDADTFFPMPDMSQWVCNWALHHPKDDAHQYDFTFRNYIRRDPSQVSRLGK